MQDSVVEYLNLLKDTAAAQSDRLNIAIVPFSDLVNIKSPFPDKNGKVLDFSVRDQTSAIDLINPIMPRPSETDPNAWARVKDIWESYFIGSDWQYIDVRGENTGRSYESAFYHGVLDSDPTSFEAYESGSTLGAGYLDESHTNFVTYDNGDYFLIENTTNPPPPSGPYYYTDKKRGLACVKGGAAATAFGDWLKFAGVDKDGNPDNNCRSLPIWSNPLWTVFLTGKEWNGCVETRDTDDDGQENTDITLSIDPNNNKGKLTVHEYSISRASRTNGTFDVVIDGIGHTYIKANPPTNEYGAFDEIDTTQPMYSIHKLNSFYNNYVAGGEEYYIGNPCDNPPVMPLQNDFDQMIEYIKGKIPNIKKPAPNGGTKLGEGLYWAWHMISPNPPFDAAAPYDGKLGKAIIIISDGEAEDTERFLALCEKIKTTNGDVPTDKPLTKIFGVAVDLDSPTLKQCSSDESYYSVSSGELAQKLKEIALTGTPLAIIE
jgi:hypothetical protein